MDYKRILLFAGHYGSGKTNIAVNVAMHLQRERGSVTIADLDIVNPYFRTKDSQRDLEAAGIRLICSEYAGTNLDAPALPPDMYAITDDRSRTAVMDIGGDDRGALALGRYAPAIREEGNYEMLLVINGYRPLTRDVASTLEIIHEIETAGGIPFTAIVNNSNLGEETDAETVLASLAYAHEISEATGLPIKMTTVREELYEDLKHKIPDLFPLTLQYKIK
ncbi:MAG: hypothetical protein IJW99_06145 [Clostridia bacterium]|nr:hypothetical protein [Clostridia bacterium]